jgi:hypothetical protein
MSETIEQAIIDAIEASDVKTADGLRSAVYRQVQGLGFDVSALVRAARDRAMEDAIEKLKKARSRGPHYEGMARRIKARPKVFPTEPTPAKVKKPTGTPLASTPAGRPLSKASTTMPACAPAQAIANRQGARA